MASGTQIPFEDLKAGQRVKITQRVKVGLKIWQTEVTGTVERAKRRRSPWMNSRTWNCWVEPGRFFPV